MFSNDWQSVFLQFRGQNNNQILPISKMGNQDLRKGKAKSTSHKKGLKSVEYVKGFKKCSKKFTSYKKKTK